MKLLASLNNDERPSHVFIVGADTDCCILKIATDLFEKSIWPIVLTNYCDSNGGPKFHEAGLLAMTRLLGEKCLVPGKIKTSTQLNEILADRNS